MARTFSATINLKDLEGSRSFANAKGNFECVALIQQTTAAPHTTMWTQGKKVLDCVPGEIPSGTVIATFDENRKYPTSARHAALYIGHNDEGITVVDQWNSQGMAKWRTIRKKGSPARDVNDAHYYFIVETQD
jgi:hypothetical protein